MSELDEIYLKNESRNAWGAFRDAVEVRKLDLAEYRQKYDRLSTIATRIALAALFIGILIGHYLWR